HAHDHAQGGISIIEKGKNGETYMMGGNSEYSVLDTAKALLNVMGLTENMLEYQKDRPGQDRRYAIDYTKINRDLAWQPSQTFEEGLRDMVQWYRKNEAWWRPIRQSSAYREWFKLQFGRVL
ncbi:MAG: GDP-mannose 4,6-dehydratase, partial [Patescibacteria group bacterium]